MNNSRRFLCCVQVILRSAQRRLRRHTGKSWTGERRSPFLQRCPYQRRQRTSSSGEELIPSPRWKSVGSDYTCTCRPKNKGLIHVLTKAMKSLKLLFLECSVSGWKVILWTIYIIAAWVWLCVGSVFTVVLLIWTVYVLNVLDELHVTACVLRCCVSLVIEVLWCEGSVVRRRTGLVPQVSRKSSPIHFLRAWTTTISGIVLSSCVHVKQHESWIIHSI